MTILKAEKFGFSQNLDNNYFALNSILDALEQSSEYTHIIFPPGTFRFTHDYYHSFSQPISNHSNSIRRSLFHLENLSNLSLEGNQTIFLFSGDIIPFAILNCSNVMIRGITIDFIDPFCLQGTVVRKGLFSYDLEMNKEHKCAAGIRGLSMLSGNERIRQIEGTEWDSRRKRRKYRARASWIMTGMARQLSSGRIRIYSPGRPDIGNCMVFRVGDRTQPGLLIHNSRSIRLEEVKIHHSKAMGVLSQMSEDICLERVAVEPAPGSGRLFSGRDDAFHFSNCRGEISLKSCRAVAQMDDGLNVHGTYLKAERITLSTIRLRFGHSQSRGFNPIREGDLISLRKKGTLEEIASARCISAVFTNENTVEVLLDRSVNIPHHTIAENMSCVPDLLVENCRFRDNRARAILVTSPGRVRIVNNHLAPTGAAVLIAGDAVSWYESGGVRDVEIRANHIESCNTEPFQYCKAVISILPDLKQKKGAAGFHRNIKISENIIRTFDAPILYAAHASNTVFEKNKVIRTYEYKGWQAHKSAFQFQYCEDIRINDNDLDNDLFNKTIREKT